MSFLGDWNWFDMSMSINIQEVVRHPNKPWSKKGLSGNRGLTMDIIKHLDMPNATDDWNWYIISARINIQEVINNPNEPWNLQGLSKNPGINLYVYNSLNMPNKVGIWIMEEILQYMVLDEVISTDIYIQSDSKFHLSFNPTIRVSHIHFVNSKYTYSKFNYFFISKYIDIREVINHPNEPWSREGLSCNKGLTMDIIKYLNMPNATGNWNWSDISKYIDIQEIMNNPDEPWNKKFISNNIGITFDIANTIKLPNSINSWDYSNISLVVHTNNMKYVRSNYMKNTHWYKNWLSSNKDLTIKDIDIIDSGYYYILSYDKFIPNKWRYHYDIQFVL